MSAPGYINQQTVIDGWLSAHRHGSDELHRQLMQNMAIYRLLPERYQTVVCAFTTRFYRGKTVLAHPDIDQIERLLLVTAATASLVGAAQQTRYFECLDWVYFCSDDLDVDGDAFQTTTVRLNAHLVVAEARELCPGHNVVVHEFAHILDHLLGVSGSTRALREGYDDYLDNIQSGSEVIADCLTPFDHFDGAMEDSSQTALHSPEEFFAVASEAFFTNSMPLREEYPALYQDLQSIYGLDMASYVADYSSQTQGGFLL